MRNQSSHFRTDWTHSFSTSEVRRQRHQVLETCAPSAKSLGGGRRERSIAQILRNPLFSPQPRSKHRLEDRKRMQEGAGGYTRVSGAPAAPSATQLQWAPSAGTCRAPRRAQAAQPNRLFFFCDFRYFLRCCPFLLTTLPPLKQPSEGLTLPWHPVVSGLLPKCKPVRALRAQAPSPPSRAQRTPPAHRHSAQKLIPTKFSADTCHFHPYFHGNRHGTGQDKAGTTNPAHIAEDGANANEQEEINTSS